MKINNLICEAYNGEITILFIGAGGTGSLLLHMLARMAVAIKEVRNVELNVIVMDGDTVSNSNIGRQLFTSYDVGRSKAAILIERINRFYGLNWNASAFNYPLKGEFPAPEKFFIRNIMLTCVDTVKSRIEIEKYIKQYQASKFTHADHGHRFAYWIDCGNSHSSGNVVLTDMDKLPLISSYLSDVKPNRKRATCSLAMALGRQHLMVNSWAANIAGTMLWNMLYELKVDIHAAFYNIETMQVRTIKTSKYENNTMDAVQGRGQERLVSV